MSVIKDKPGYVRPNSFSEAIERSSKTILDIRKSGGVEKLTGWVMGRLIELFTYLGAFEIVTEYQVQMLATRICAKFFYFSPTELDYFFLRFENGEYGTMYVGKSINPQIVMTALIKYEEELQNARGEAESKKKLQEESKRHADEKAKAVSWEEYCKQNGFEGRPNPLDKLKESFNVKLN